MDGRMGRERGGEGGGRTTAGEASDVLEACDREGGCGVVGEVVTEVVVGVAVKVLLQLESRVDHGG